MKESLARTLGGYVGLGESPSHDAAPVDKLHSVGAAQRAGKLACLGFEFIRLKVSNIPEAYQPCRDGLAEELLERRDSLRIKRDNAELIAAQVIQEFVISYCPVCLGRGEVVAGDGRDGAVPMKACPPPPEGCGGHGQRRYTDEERAVSVGAEKNLDRAFFEAHAILSSAIREALWNYRRLFRS